MELNVVLHEPRIPQNAGNIARTCACVGARLHLIRPMGFTVSDAHLKRAGLDYWRYLDVHYYDSADEFFLKTADIPGVSYRLFSTKARTLYTKADYPDGVFLIFGREDKGLPETMLLSRENDCVRLPMLDDRRSLNLSNSVAVGVYEALRQWGFPALSLAGELAEYNWDEHSFNG
jgi:tRNA (cytidine/uridine-2'-O-)-methyltransferase